MSTRKKKYNPMKTIQTQASYGLKNLAVFFSQAKGESCDVVNTKSFNNIQITQSIATAITGLRHNWSITMLALGRRQDGQEYFKAENVSFNVPMFQSELSDALQDMHKDFINRSMNKLHLCNICWFACPRGTDFDESHLGEMLTKLDAWDNESEWELQCQ